MAYQWDRYDRETGELHTIVEEGEPCECVGGDLPHPPDLCAEIREVPEWDDTDPAMWAEPTDGERALEEWLRWHDPEYLAEIKAARSAGYGVPDTHRTLVPPWADPATAHLTEHFGWNGDHQWARTIRPDPRYL